VRRLLETSAEPLLLDGREDAWAGVLLVHAPGESRSGNNFLMAQVAQTLARAGLLTGRFDLSGQGDSLGPVDSARWLEQTAEAVLIMAELTPGPVHAIGHAASAALIATATGHRVALCPPAPAELRSLASLAGTRPTLVASADMTPKERELWEALGTEPQLAEGLEFPVTVLTNLADLLEQRPWDTAAVPAPAAAEHRSALVVAERDRLLRLEVVRLGAAELIAHHLASVNG